MNPETLEKIGNSKFYAPYLIECYSSIEFLTWQPTHALYLMVHICHAEAFVVESGTHLTKSAVWLKSVNPLAAAVE